MLEFLKRLRRLWMMSARRTDPDSLPALIAEGVVEFGAHSYGEPRVIVWRSPVRGRMFDRVVIGKYCQIGANVQMFTGGNHRTDWIAMFPFRNRWDLPGRDYDGATRSKGDIVIGNDVWIGEGAVIMSGVTVGHGAAIGAYAVVSKDVPPYALVAGNPARVIRYRFEPDQVAALLGLAWWDWPEDRVRDLVPLLNSGDVAGLLRSR